MQNKKQSSTVKSYISAIKAVLREDNQKISEKDYLIASLTKACRLQNDQIAMRLPIQKGLLGMILQQVSRKFENRDSSQPFLTALYKAIFSTMYHGLLRIGEAASGAHPILARDVHIGTNKRKFLLILQTSKTHWKNSRPQMIKISATKIENETVAQNPRTKNKGINTGTKLPCPYLLLKKYATLRGNFHEDQEPFFVFADKSPVTPRHVSVVLKGCIKAAGFDETLYTAHSLRSGRTCDLCKLGLSVETIKKLGRWKSNAVYRYLRY